MKVMKIVGTSSKMQVYLKDGPIIEMEGEFTIGGFAASMNSMRWKGSDEELSLEEKESFSKEIQKYNRGNKEFIIDIYPD